MQRNAAGEVVYDLLHKQWNTTATFSLQNSSQIFGIRGFHGAYTVNVLYEGKEIDTHYFYMSKGQDVTVKIDV